MKNCYNFALILIQVGQRSSLTEMYDEVTDQWTTISDTEELYGHNHFSVVNCRGGVFTFGGYLKADGLDNTTRDVYKLYANKDDTLFHWSKFEHSLIAPRSQHTSIVNGLFPDTYLSITSVKTIT